MEEGRWGGVLKSNLTSAIRGTDSFLSFVPMRDVVAQYILFEIVINLDQ